MTRPYYRSPWDQAARVPQAPPDHAYPGQPASSVFTAQGARPPTAGAQQQEQQQRAAAIFLQALKARMTRGV